MLELAFGSSAEADLVDRLRARDAVPLALVATLEDEVVGHVAFSLMTFDDGRASPIVWALGPMGVLPEHQRKGVGSLLISKGLEECRRAGVQAVFVLGHPAFYPRFGLVPASRFAIACEFPVPDEVFMAMELVPGALQGVSGIVRYHPEFREV